MLELAGIDNPVLVDGVSLVPLLKDKSILERSLYWHYPHYGNQGGDPSAIIRKGNWKLIYYFEPLLRYQLLHWDQPYSFGQTNNYYQ